MNYIKHLTGFFDKVSKDKILNPTHVSLYIALFQFWNCNRFKNPISISRDEVMRISKISSKATYHKCLKNLHSLGYINYEPSYNPFKGSQVYLFNLADELKPMPKSERNTSSNTEPVFKLVDEQLVNKSCTSSDTGTEQALVPYINNTNNTNNQNIIKIVNGNEQAQNFKDDDSFFKKVDTEMPLAFADTNKNQTEGGQQKKEKKLREKKKSFSDSTTKKISKKEIVGKEPPPFEEIKTYFLEQIFPEIEAQKFFNYFSSNGWLVGGKTPMVEWKAAAQNWMINANKFNSNEQNQPNRAKHLNTTVDKDYSEPL
ncbi:hypothetical protein SAMN05443667_11545 [Flavobacterium gillisiae]|jgi:hypothetical protein|uniref:Uncharacterized protein n=1 Tax=Flavobacterium gillisiae TaxID=150146 RepID=A0A1H4FWS9_9FLAO|nr:transcriptional regulator [Flavobacterium gillisiae]SEB01290.1 hypothetical protein SAMN05443667_11545 [Flavobacterium gillisiae]